MGGADRNLKKRGVEGEGLPGGVDRGASPPQGNKKRLAAVRGAISNNLSSLS